MTNGGDENISWPCPWYTIVGKPNRSQAAHVLPNEAPQRLPASVTVVSSFAKHAKEKDVLHRPREDMRPAHGSLKKDQVTNDAGCSEVKHLFGLWRARTCQCAMMVRETADDTLV